MNAARRLCQCMTAVLFGMAVLCGACAGRPSASEADEWNRRAFSLRYTDIDSSLHCANRALDCAAPHTSEWAFALNNLAFVRYQQMHYTEAMHLLDQLHAHSRDQIELLCADVMYMKVAQRIDQGMDFFRHRDAALKRLDRMAEDDVTLSDRQAARLTYARTELHIISSTYYFYYGLIPQAVAEISLASADPALPSDTTQWIYYQYMVGSGGMLSGDGDEVALQEFDHLFRAYSHSLPQKNVYFQANALQSMASLLDSAHTDSLLQRERPNAYAYLQRIHADWHPLHHGEADSLLSMRLADHAVHIFAGYKDSFQLACACRTVGEICFNHGLYRQALGHFSRALSLIDRQQRHSEWEVPFWTAGIRERLSMVYSALGDKEQSDRNRNAYLDLLGRFTQDYEMEERRQMLQHEMRHTHRGLALLATLVALAGVLMWLLARRMRNQSLRTLHSLRHVEDSEANAAFLRSAEQTRTALEQRAAEMAEMLEASGRRVVRCKQEHADRRAKVSVVYSLFPLLDRMMAEVDRMVTDGHTDERRLQYVEELAQEVMHVNDALTQWIQMRQGQLRLGVTSFALQPLFQIIESSRPIFTRTGLTLNVSLTQSVVKADRALTLFMINTLTENARKFTPSGGTVSLQADEHDGYVEISVADTGVGLTEEDVAQLTGSKYYDPSRIGTPGLGKGFGFGIMNCKGIIAKYRKTSSRFQVCDFGVQSSKGKGSRFWFRLPLAVALLALCMGMHAVGTGRDMSATDGHSLRDSAWQANLEGRYREAYDYGQRQLARMEPPTDTFYTIYLLNEMAISSLALKQWDDYRRCNAECVRLHQLYTADNTLPAVCRQLERLQANAVFIYALLVLVSLVSLLLFLQLVVRKRLRGDSDTQQAYDWVTEALARARELTDQYATAEEHPQPEEPFRLLEQAAATVRGNTLLEDAVHRVKQQLEETFGQCHTQLDEIQRQADALARMQYEGDRLYVMNQVMDNCLSTIKHETMYYPARAQQLVGLLQRTGGDAEEQAEGLEQLSSLLHFYREVYGLLYEQAERQTHPSGFVRERVTLSDIRPQLGALQVVADRTLLTYLMRLLDEPAAPAVDYGAQPSGGCVYVTLTFRGTGKTAEQLSQMFQPTGGDARCMTARQIVRDHDTACGHPGLRLAALPLDGEEAGYRIVFSLVQWGGRDKREQE